MRSNHTTRALLAGSVIAVTALTACSSSSSGKKISLVAYSVPKPAYDALSAAFEKTSDGKGAKIAASYGASGDQSRAVLNGQKADYVAFSLEPDMTKLVPKFVDASWNSGPTKGLVSKSVVVLVVRKGNPKKITGWDDLIKPGIKIVTPDPASSGSAKWNILAAYTHVLEDGGTASRGRRVPHQVLRQRRGQARERFEGDADLHQRHRRRPRLLRERGHRRPAEGFAGRLHRAQGVDPDREPGRGDQEGAPRRPRRSSPSTRAKPARRSSPPTVTARC